MTDIGLGNPELLLSTGILLISESRLLKMQHKRLAFTTDNLTDK